MLRRFAPICYATKHIETLIASPSVFIVSVWEKILSHVASLNNCPTHNTQPHTHTHHSHVFLGGSCSPTTWRRDIIMPMLERANISCFNPQVRSGQVSKFCAARVGVIVRCVLKLHSDLGRG